MYYHSYSKLNFSILFNNSENEQNNLSQNEASEVLRNALKQSYEIIGEETVSDVIIERIVDDVQRIELKGESLGKRKVELSENDYI